MPHNYESSVRFKNFNARCFTPFVIYFDLESLLVPVQTAHNDPTKSSTTVIEQHTPCSYCIVVVEIDKQEPKFVELYRGVDAMERFIKTIERLAKQIHELKRTHVTFTGTNVTPRETADVCWICEQPFVDSVKVLDHCHFSNKFLGWAHNECNLKRRTQNFTPVFAHNLQNYDLHHVMKALVACRENSKFSIVPSTDEKFIALEMGVFIKSVTDKNGKTSPIYEYMRFVDSFKFMPQSLAKLVDMLPSEAFNLFDSHFSGYNVSQRNLLKAKGHYPYSFFDSFTKFNHPHIPPLAQWKNSLLNNEISVTKEEFNHAKRVYATFKCKNMGEYHDIYLTCDTLLLACVFEQFRKVCNSTYGLDCAQFYTTSNLAGAAYLKICRPELELLTQREMLNMTENLIRGGVASIYHKRLSVANNKFLNDFDTTKPSTFIWFVDANNLYGGIMKHYRLPLRNFHWTNDTLEEIIQTSEDSDYGYVVEVDLDYPVELHDHHKDYPLAPTKEVVQKAWLGTYQRELLIKSKVPVESTKTRKLLQTLHNKRNYTIHYITLKLYIELGLKVTKLHRALKFEQTNWLASYITLNTTKRQQATNKFEEDFYKLMSNAAYGKTCEGKRNRVNVKVVRKKDQLLTEMAKPNVKSFKIISEELATVTTKPTRVLWDKPTIVGAVILDLAKMFMAQFHYKVMKSEFNCSLLYSDTDSFVYEIQCDDLYEAIASKPHLKNSFDFSNFPTNHPLYDTTNAKTVLKFKDELGGKVIKRLCALKPKLYMMETMCGTTKTSARGTTRSAQSFLAPQNFVETLQTGSTMRTPNVRIASTSHTIQTVVSNKVSLRAYDDKRFILPDGIHTLPFGHYSLEEETAVNQILDSPEWGDEHMDVPPKSPFAEFIETGFASNFFTPPDPGFNQSSYNESELDIFDFDASLRETPLPHNPFIEFEAVESPSDTHTPPPMSPILFSDHSESSGSPSLFQNISYQLAGQEAYFESDIDDIILPPNKRKTNNFLDSD